MAKLHIIQFDEDSAEAVVQIYVDIDINNPQYIEPASNGRFVLTAFWHPASFCAQDVRIYLFSFLTSNIIREERIQTPKKTGSGFFSYHIFANVVDAQNRHVRCGDVDVILDRPIPGDIMDGDIISFDTQRMDVQHQN